MFFLNNKLISNFNYFKNNSVVFDQADKDFFLKFLTKVPADQELLWQNKFLEIKQKSKKEFHLHAEGILPVDFSVEMIRKYSDFLDWNWLANHDPYSKFPSPRLPKLCSKTEKDQAGYVSLFKQYLLNAPFKDIQKSFSLSGSGDLLDFRDRSPFSLSAVLFYRCFQNAPVNIHESFLQEAAKKIVEIFRQDNIEEVHLRYNSFMNKYMQNSWLKLLSYINDFKENVNILMFLSINRTILARGNHKYYKDNIIPSIFNLRSDLKDIFYGFDIAGPEGAASSEEFLSLKFVEELTEFLSEKINKKLLIYAHAGERQIQDTLEGLNTINLTANLNNINRLGHMVSLGYGLKSEDLAIKLKAEEIVKKIIDKNIIVDLNIFSNQAILGIPAEENPAIKLADYGIPITYSTDDPNCTGMRLSWEHLEIERLKLARLA